MIRPFMPWRHSGRHGTPAWIALDTLAVVARSIIAVPARSLRVLVLFVVAPCAWRPPALGLPALAWGFGPASLPGLGCRAAAPLSGRLSGFRFGPCGGTGETDARAFLASDA